MRHLVLVSVLGLIAASAGTLRAQITPANITADDGIDSTARAVRFLKSRQKPDNPRPDRVLYRGGLTPLCTLALLNRVVRRSAPVLEAVKIGERYAVLFSPYDVSCALETLEPLNCDGYSQADAARLALNVLLYSLH